MTATEDIFPKNVEQEQLSIQSDSEPGAKPSTDNVAASSPSPPPARQASYPSLTEQYEATHEEPIDPQIITLQGMFPDFDVSLLQSVLESVGGDQDKAIDILLGMSDPSYKSTARDEMSQTELDEQFARTLLLEESQQQPSWTPHAPSEELPYVPRSGVPQPPHGPAPSSHEGDSMAQIQEQLGKFAETGKRTFTSFLSKVKAKIQEFDSPQGSQSHPTPQESSPSYYDPNPSPPRVNDAVPSHHFATQPTPADVHKVPTGPDGPTVAPYSVPGASAPTTVDPVKIGLLPKRPVSLGSSPQPSKTGDEDEDIEYIENPFEEPSHR